MTIVFRRGLLFTAGGIAWAMVAAQLFYSQPAQSYTPFIDNVRRAINSCKVVGRLANEGQGGTVSFKSKLLCLGTGQQP